MWRPWSKSSSKISDTNSNIHSFSPKHNFRCSSFKDIEILCNLDLDNLNLNNNNNNNLTFPKNTTSTSTSNFKSPLQRQPSAPAQIQTQPQAQPQPRRSIFHRVRNANTLLRQWPTRSDAPPKPDPKNEPPIPIPTTPTTPRKNPTRIVIYYTSLRVIRPTFEACRSVMSILQGFQVILDERDLAMDLGFMSELRELLGLNPNEELTLPRVFIGGRYIGGAEEIVRLHEIGELKELVSGVPLKKPGTCDTCGGYRFILCATCSGSHKIFSEKVGFRCCKSCNENGLVRCPSCSYTPNLPPININNSNDGF